MKNKATYLSIFLMVFISLGTKAQTISGKSLKRIATVKQSKNKLWSGKWNSRYGVVMLSQKGTQVTGSYRTKGTFNGKVQGNTLTGTFNNGNGKSGNFKWEMSADGTTFLGRWSYTGKTSNTYWSAARSNVKNLEWGNKWNSNKGALAIIKKGSNYSGTLGKKGTIKAKSFGNLLVGTYKDDTGKSGELHLYLSNDGKSFKGKSYDSKTGKTSFWSGNPINSKTTIVKLTKQEKLNPILVNGLPNNNGRVIMQKGTRLKYPFKPFTKKTNVTEKGNKEELVINNNELDIEVKTIPKGDPKTSNSDTENCITTKSEVKVGTTAFKDFARGSTAEWLLPGNMFTSRSFLRGTYAPLDRKVKRNPIALFLRDIESSNGNKSQLVQKPHSVSELSNAVGTLKSQQVKEIPSQTVFSMKEIKSTEEFSYSITGKYSNKAAGIGVSLGLKSEDKQDGYYLLITFEQAMYNITVDDRISDEIFSVNPNNPEDLVYISNVTYGRKGIMMVKTSKSLKSLGVNAGVSYDKGIHKGSLKGTLKKIAKDESATVEMLFYGGDSPQTNMALSDFLKDENGNEKDVFAEWIAKGNVKDRNGFISKNALPISYTIKNLKGEQLGLQSTFHKTNITCIPNRNYRVKIKLDHIRSWLAEDSDNTDDYAIEFIPKLTIKGKNYPLKNRVFSLSKAKNERYSRNANHLWSYNAKNNQLAVKEKETKTINNYGTFEIPKGLDLREAELEIKFRVWEASGKHKNGNPKLNRLYGVSSIGGYNYHKLNVNELIQVLMGTTKLKDTATCGDNNGGCRAGRNGSYGYEKYNISQKLVPFSADSSRPEILTFDEVMFSSSHTRKMVLRYNIELLPELF